MMKTISAIALFFFLSCAAFAQPLSLSLKEAQQMAVDSSYATRDARYATQKKKKEVKEVLSAGLPQIRGAANLQKFLDIPVSLVPAQFFGGQEGEFAEVKFGTEYNLSGSVSASQLLFDGTYFVGLQAAKTVVELSRNQEKKSEFEIKSQVANAYYTVLITRENIDILEDNLATLNKTLDDTRALFENGLTEEQDVDQIELNKNQVEINIDNSESFLDVSKQSLNFLLGIPINRDVNLTDSISQLVQMSSDREYLQRDPELLTHPDYLLAKTNVEIQELTIRGEKAAYYPRLDAIFNHEQVAQRNEFNFTESGMPWFPTTIIGLSLEVPIFSGFRRNARLQQAQIGMKQSRMQLEQTEQNLQLQIERARSNYQNALKTWENQKENMELAKRIRRKTNVKYTEGISSSFELNVAESQLLDAQSRYIQSILDLLNAKQELDKALNIY